MGELFDLFRGIFNGRDLQAEFNEEAYLRERKYLEAEEAHESRCLAETTEVAEAEMSAGREEDGVLVHYNDLPW